jgi:hypothetical protein
MEYAGFWKASSGFAFGSSKEHTRCDFLVDCFCQVVISCLSQLVNLFCNFVIEEVCFKLSDVDLNQSRAAGTNVPKRWSCQQSKILIEESLVFKIDEDSSMIGIEAVIEGFCATSSDVGGNGWSH